MLDQMFTAENFRRIFDNENRKGHDLSARFFPNLEPHTFAVRESVKHVRELRSIQATLKSDEFNRQLADLKDRLADFKSAKSTAIDVELEALSHKAVMPNFKIALSQKMGPNEKPVFCTDQSPETFFVVKQLQHNLNRIYDVKQANRHDIVCQVRDTVNSKFPFEIIRTDISSFYETIDRKKLIKKLDLDQLLSPSSKKYIKQILDSYGEISQNQIGIPRGVGISAYLAELYLRPVDHSIRAIPGTVLYCRFVDDIIAVFARPQIGKDLGSYVDTVIDILKNNGLSHNASKTREFDLSTPGRKKFEYLGYRFKLDSGKCDISPSSAKIKKYKMRLKSAFKDYHNHSSFDSRRASRNIVARTKFLTGNTRLSNSKSRAVTGIYYNNSLVTNNSSFQRLDRLLKKQVKDTKRTKLQKRLKKFQFEEGFETRRFHHFSTKELHRIVEVWKHG